MPGVLQVPAEQAANHRLVVDDENGPSSVFTAKWLRHRKGHYPIASRITRGEPSLIRGSAPRSVLVGAEGTPEGPMVPLGVMTDRKFWQKRWDAGRIGFHLGRPHPSLERFIGHLGLRTESRVLVPLAGKAADVEMLSEHAGKVYANEYVERAAQDYFAERGLDPVALGAGDELRLSAGNVTFVCKDFFGLEPTDLGGAVDAAFDRASLVAIDAPRRPAYARKLAKLVAPAGRVLLIVFAYDQSRTEGPPFSVPPDEVHDLFAEHFRITALDRSEAKVGPRFAEAGIPTVEEHTLLLERLG